MFGRSGIYKNDAKERELRTLPGPGQYQVEKVKQSKSKSFKFGKQTKEPKNVYQTGDRVGPASYRQSESQTRYRSRVAVISKAKKQCDTSREISPGPGQYQSTKSDFNQNKGHVIPQ